MLSKMLAGVKTRINCNYLWLTYGSLWEPVFISQDKSSKNLRFILIFFILILTNSERCCISDFIMLNGSGIHLDSYTKPKEICALTNSLLQSRFSLGVLCRVHQGNLLSNPLLSKPYVRTTGGITSGDARSPHFFFENFMWESSWHGSLASICTGGKAGFDSLKEWRLLRSCWPTAELSCFTS